MREQKNTLHYHQYCTGHGFQTYIDKDWVKCNICGDLASMYIFSFDSEDEFAQKYVYENLLAYYQNDEETLTFQELSEEVGINRIQEKEDEARKVYRDLLEKVWV